MTRYGCLALYQRLNSVQLCPWGGGGYVSEKFVRVCVGGVKTA